MTRVYGPDSRQRQRSLSIESSDQGPSTSTRQSTRQSSTRQRSRSRSNSLFEENKENEKQKTYHEDNLCQYIEELTNFIRTSGYLDLKDGRFNFYRWNKAIGDKDPVLCSKWACELKPVHDTNLRLAINFNKDPNDYDVCSENKCCMTGANHFFAVKYNKYNNSCLVICNYEDRTAYLEIRLYLFYLEYKQRLKNKFDSRLGYMQEYAYNNPDFQLIINNITEDTNEIRFLIRSINSKKY